MNNMLRLKYYPISFFSAILGLGGFTVASQKFEALYRDKLFFSNIVLFFTLTIFLLIAVTYLCKFIMHPGDVKAEFDHPVKLSFFSTIPISFIILSIPLMEIDPNISAAFWWIGMPVQLLLSLSIINLWVHHEKFKIQHLSPAWFIPVVGNIIVPVSGVFHFHPDLSWFFFSVGLLFWIVLLVLFFNRIIFHSPLPIKLIPTFFIMIAPPAIAFISYTRLNGGELDHFGRILYFSGMFFTLLLLSQVPRFTRIPFFLSWWAYSFPLSAAALSTFLMFHQTHSDFYGVLAQIFYILLTLVIIFLIFRTLTAMAGKAICVEEND